MAALGWRVTTLVTYNLTTEYLADMFAPLASWAATDTLGKVTLVATTVLADNRAMVTFGRVDPARDDTQAIVREGTYSPAGQAMYDAIVEAVQCAFQGRA